MPTAVNPTTGERVELVNGQWVPVGPGGPSSGPKPRPDWGQGAMELPNGAIVRSGPRGGLTVLQAAQGGGTAGSIASGGATGEAKNRLAIMSGPAIEAGRELSSIEAKHGNPLNTLTGGLAQTLMGDADAGQWTDAAAKFVGGQTFQSYKQSSKAFEAAMLPIFSGAAVTPSEAQRMTRAALPQMGDSRETLARKDRTRKMMLNGAASLQGKEAPFPDVPAWDFKGGAPAGGGRARKGQATPEKLGRFTPEQRRAVSRFRGSAAEPGTPGSPLVPTTEEQYRNIPSGAVYLHRDGSLRTKP